MLSYRNRTSFSDILEKTDSWETIGIELLHRKYKFEFTPFEKELLKNMLKNSPPPLHTRRKVRFNN
jgi:hypothetical protein